MNCAMSARVRSTLYIGSRCQAVPCEVGYSLPNIIHDDGAKGILIQA
jgi:hypothetical protein